MGQVLGFAHCKEAPSTASTTPDSTEGGGEDPSFPALPPPPPPEEEEEDEEDEDAARATPQSPRDPPRELTFSYIAFRGGLGGAPHPQPRRDPRRGRAPRLSSPRGPDPRARAPQKRPGGGGETPAHPEGTPLEMEGGGGEETPPRSPEAPAPLPAPPPGGALPPPAPQPPPAPAPPPTRTDQSASAARPDGQGERPMGARGGRGRARGPISGRVPRPPAPLAAKNRGVTPPKKTGSGRGSHGGNGAGPAVLARSRALGAGAAGGPGGAGVAVALQRRLGGGARGAGRAGCHCPHAPATDGPGGAEATPRRAPRAGCPRGPVPRAAAALGAAPGATRGDSHAHPDPALPRAQRPRVPQVRLPVLPADLRGGGVQRGDTAGRGCRQRLHLPRALPAPPGPDRPTPEPGAEPPEPPASQGPGQAPKCQSEAAVTPLSPAVPSPPSGDSEERGGWRGGGVALSPPPTQCPLPPHFNKNSCDSRG